MRAGRSVPMLRDAATIWCFAMVGLMIGAREFAGAVIVTIRVLTVAVMLRPIAACIDNHRAQRKLANHGLDG